MELSAGGSVAVLGLAGPPDGAQQARRPPPDGSGPEPVGPVLTRARSGRASCARQVAAPRTMATAPRP
ncbi:hypothetical protein, partial [Micromonospora palythoicola]|uniref:hypothetical protein n=1 Tax=Micromonospora palythoicola TaxID=3120507 RepID=UPI002FCDF195